MLLPVAQRGDHGGGLPPRGQRRRRARSRRSASASAAATSARSSPTSSPAAAACSTTSWTATGGEQSPSTAGLDVGAVPGSPVVSPGRRQGDGDQEVQHPRPLQGRRDRHPAGRATRRCCSSSRTSPSPRCEIGDVVQRGTTTLGVRARVPGGARPGAQPVHLGQRRPRAADGAARDAGAGGPVSAAAAVPAATRAVIGGSGSLAADFPGDLHPDARVLETGLVFETPWGESPPFTLFELGGQRALHVQDARLAQGRLARARLAPGLQRAAPRRRQADPLGRRRRQPQPPARPRRPRGRRTTSST